ncbi:MAG: hypothetical protein ACI9AT_001858 [Ulvibacter sp.]
MRTQINIGIWIVFIIVLCGCYGITKPDENPGVKDPNSKSAEVSILENEFGIIGSLTSDLKPKKMSIDTDIANWRYEVSYWTPKEIVEGVKIDFHFQNDSICQHKFEEIKSWMESEWGEASCPERFCSWEIPSSRTYATTVLLSNMSAFFKTSTIEINILENDNRVYRK